MTSSSEVDWREMAKDPKRKARSADPGWKYAFWPNLENKDVVKCLLCGNENHAGIKRLKMHLIGGYGDIRKCSKTTPEIAKEMREAIEKKRKCNVVDVDDNDDDDRDSNVVASSEASFPSSGTAVKRRAAAFSFAKSQPKVTKSVASMTARSPEEVVDDRHSKGPHQTTLENRVRTKEEVEKVHMYIANFFYECGVPFNAANSRSFEVMIEGIGQFGPGLNPPTYHQLRVPYLKKAKDETDKLRAKHEIAWRKYGCTLMSDGWTDRRGRHLINFLANSPEGTFFLGSVNASNQSHDAPMLADLLESKINEIGQKNVVQVVTDNGANYKAAGALLERRIPTIYWTPCAAHCIDLMLEDVGKIKDFKKTIFQAKRCTTFIYRHGRVLDTVRETSGRDLVRTGATRFATAFLTLQSLYRNKDALRVVFSGDDWIYSKLSKTQNGKKVADTVFSINFWRSVEECIQASQPLLVVLRIVDGDEKSALPEITYAMDYAKKKIRDKFGNKKVLLDKVIKIIEDRWESQMCKPIYGAGLFLNPGKYFDVVESDPVWASRLREDFNDVLEKLISDRSLRHKISNYADDYKNSREGFSREMAVEQRKLKNPIDWWDAYGGKAIELQSFAKRIVGLCCSSSGCERNWSTFEFIHTKKRNRLEHQRLNDLVYVQYNRKIESRFKRRRELGRNFDPIILEDFEWSNEFIDNENGEVHNPGDDEDLWRQVDLICNASSTLEGRNLPRRATGANTGDIATYRRRHSSGCSSSRQSTHDSDSDDLTEEENIPLDDEDVDDYGLQPTYTREASTPSGEKNREGHAIELDDFA